MENDTEQKQDINQTAQVQIENDDSVQINQKLISNEMYMQKLIENFGYSPADLEYVDLPPPLYSELSMPMSTWKQQYAKAQIVTVSTSKPSKFFLFLSLIYFIRNIFEAVLGFTLASLSDHVLLFSIWPGSFLFNGFIILYIAYQRSSELIERSRYIYLMLLFSHILYLLTVYFSLRIPDLSLTICPLFSKAFCFDTASSFLQLILVCTICLGAIHDLFNIQMAYVIHYKAKSTLSTMVF